VEVLLVLVVLAVVAGAVFVGVSVRSRGRGGVELEPPPVAAPPRPVAPPVEVLEPGPQPVVVEPEPVAVEPVAVEPEPVAARPRFRDRLTKARTLLAGYVGSVLSRSAIDDDTWDELEEALIRADVGATVTNDLLDDLRSRVKADKVTTPQELLDALKGDLVDVLSEGDRTLTLQQGDAPDVWLFVGVNGVGKTTTIGKVGKREAANGRKVVMAAGDTFRAAAAEQLELWAKRAGADLVRGAEGADPGSVVFDAVERAAARDADLVLADTAGRLHTKVNLMEELKKVRRVAEKAGNVSECLLVLDATTGQNGLVQAKEFTSAVGCTGIVLTKLDGTAKGGIAVAITREMGLPIKLVGLGESADDLVEFDPAEFVDALFD
jgi:fused signal recognition particle receptor